MIEIQLKADFITLAQALKEIGVISTGGQAKWYLKENLVLVNEQPETRRGRKLYAGDLVELESHQILKIT